MKFVIATGVYPPEIGGPSTVIAALVEQLRQDAHDVTVITYGFETNGNHGAIRVSRQGSTPERYLRMASVIRRELRRSKDAVLLTTDLFSVGIPARIALSGMRNRFVIRLGGEWMWEDAVTNGGLRVTLRDYWTKHAEGFRHRIKRMLAAWVLRRAKRIAITSDLLKTPIQHISPSVLENVITVPNVPVRNDCIPTPHPPYEALRVLYAGRFAPVKNMPFFSRALRKALENGARLSMMFVGDGPERAECEEILRNVSHVRFFGTVPSRDVENLLCEADLCVLPSLSDVCPNGVLEAIGDGIPCLVTREHGLPAGVGGLEELDPTDEAAWVNALQKYASDPTALDELRKKIRLPSPPSITLKDVLLKT